MLKGYASYKVSPKMSINGYVAYFGATDEPTGQDDDMGIEFGVGMSYKLYSNLTYSAHASFLSTGDFFMFFGYVMMLYPTVLELLSGASHLTKTGASVDRVFDLLGREATEAGVFDSPLGGAAAPVRGEIEFQDVEFAYDGAVPVAVLPFLA